MLSYSIPTLNKNHASSVGHHKSEDIVRFEDLKMLNPQRYGILRMKNEDKDVVDVSRMFYPSLSHKYS